MKYRLSPDLYPPIFEEVSQMRDLYSLSTVSRGAQAEAERLMYRHLVAEDFSSMVVLLRRINLSFPGSYHTLNVSMLLAPVSHSKGIRGRVMLAFNRLFSQTLAKLTHLKILVIHMWELKPRSCKGLLQHCTFKLNLFYSWFFVDDHLSSFLEKQSELRTLFLPKQVSRSFRLSDTALPKLRALGMDKGAKAALSIIRNRPVAYLRVGGYDHGDTEIWSGLRASKSPIRGLVIPQVNVESLKLLAEVCPNLQAFYNINFRVVPQSVWFEYFHRFPHLITAEFSIDERTNMDPILKRLKAACPKIVRVYVRIYEDSISSMYRYGKDGWVESGGSWNPTPFHRSWNGYPNPWLCLVSHILVGDYRMPISHALREYAWLGNEGSGKYPFQ